MRDHTQARRGAQLDPALGGKGLQGLGLIADLHVDHVGLHRLDLIPRFAQLFAQPLSVGVVISQALHLMIQGIQPRRSQGTGLAHTATDHLAQTPGLGDQHRRAAQHRADGGT